MDGRRDLGIGSSERYWPVEVPFDSFCQIRPLEMTKNSKKNSGFSKHGHIRDSKYPLESGGGWGLFVFHKYFLVHYHFLV